ncbi:MAG: NFACT RNA binding domain-containing protein, partial [Clostridia bacterium]|nr:NFACT RNA binding domain-containing protein [Clostridia bacterium]
MAFDAGMLASVISEIKGEALGAKIEKIHQPEKDQIIIITRSISGGRKLLIDAGANNPRLGFTFSSKENPMSPPMFCMLLRKHLTGARLADIVQPEFERVAVFIFEAYDEMGFPCKRRLIAEIMGKYSNLIFTDENGKIIALLKTVDFTTSSRRQLLPGMTYEMPPKQEKLNPMETNFETFKTEYEKSPSEKGTDKFITSVFLGISSSLAREIAFRATRHTDTPLRYCTSEDLWKSFSEITEQIRCGKSYPTMIIDEGGKPIEYSFTPLTHYGEKMQKKEFDTLGELLDEFYDGRDREMRVRQRAADILHLLTNAESRLLKKIDAQENELAESAKGEEYKKYGDLITANIYMLQRGMKNVSLTDYSDMKEDGSFGEVIIALDERLSPSANAQRMYKKYNKSKNAKTELTKQLSIARNELEYIYTVFDSLSRAETSSDLSEIREELHSSGYASKMKNYSQRKNTAPLYLKFKTSGGYTVLCGKNNLQNEYITHRLAEKNDYWFHAKGVPGSHVVLVCSGEEPDGKEFTEAAEIAAHYSKLRGGQNVEVDYT